MVKIKPFESWHQSLKTKRLKNWLKTAFLGISVMSAPLFAHEIQVFTLKSHPVLFDGETATVCYLDAFDRIERRLGSIHPTMGFDEIAPFEPQLANAVHCQQEAVDLHIERLPAIAIDKTKVVYGANSVTEALRALKEGGGRVY